MTKKILFALYLLFIVVSISCHEFTQQEADPTMNALTKTRGKPGAFADKESWQRLNLWLSSTYILVVKEGQIDIDSCLSVASRSLGLSKISILGEGVDDPELFKESEWIQRGDVSTGIRLLSQLKDKRHVEGLILLGAYYAFESNSYTRYRDSVEYFLSNAIIESRSIKEERLGRQAACLLEKMYYQGLDPRRADSVFNFLIKECLSSNDKETEARAYFYRGIFAPYFPSPQINLSYYKKAADIYHTINNAEGETIAWTVIGYLMVLTQQLDKAHDAFLNALQLEEVDHYPYVHYNTDALAMVGVFQKKFGEPLKYALETVRAAEENRDSIGWAYFYARLYQLYDMEGGKEKEAEELWHKSIDRFLADRNPALYNLLPDEIGRMNAQGKNREALDLVTSLAKNVTPVSFTDVGFYHLALSIAYNGLSDFAMAKKHLIIADSLETKLEAFRGPLRRAFINRQYGYIYFSEKQYPKARAYLEKYFLGPTGATGISTDLNVYRKLIDIDSITQDLAAGIDHYKKYAQLLDSNFSVSRIRQAEELQLTYQTQEKENQIALLNQQAQLEQANLKQATLAKNLTIIGIVAVLIIAGLLYRQNRLKQRNNNLVTQKNQQLQHLVSEKEWLLKEIHHRVKNNLQIVMSLLHSQSEYIDNETALTAINDSQHRVHAMSLIHQKLYKSENLSSIDMPIYIRELVSYLADSFDTGQMIGFEYNLEPLEMDVSQAVPLGLILNEAITNSIKYAFPDKRRGTVSISLFNTAINQYLLTMADNGIGIASNFAKKKIGSLGMSLMQGLSEDLNGRFSIENNNGTIIKISFILENTIRHQDTLDSSSVSNN
jgi:two-component sensor histidine kinase